MRECHQPRERERVEVEAGGNGRGWRQIWEKEVARRKGGFGGGQWNQAEDWSMRAERMDKAQINRIDDVVGAIDGGLGTVVSGGITARGEAFCWMRQLDLFFVVVVVMRSLVVW